MKKTIYTLSVLICSLVTGNLFSQTEIKCYALTKNEGGSQENIEVKLSINGNKVEALFTKQSIINDNTAVTAIDRKGIIQGNKIIFDSTTKGSEESWSFKGESLVADNNVLQLAVCK